MGHFFPKSSSSKINRDLERKDRYKVFGSLSKASCKDFKGGLVKGALTFFSTANIFDILSDAHTSTPPGSPSQIRAASAAMQPGSTLSAAGALAKIV